ncbi:MAG: hypothetical protein KKB81_01755 [Candidatus Margulisbacteria bacterium]|nr:hypothetical protein [Candidatus Margulisiibacteriota bacterium]MBU1021641.1 hypothetical protein [Candidatus Margulisiibacteriota bacterium]MBU1728791.1 hypothetical protein [Candidatus Margulisiibacteriota bacterium]MBU1955757.1 hypothetical protein [Candidatus Margulisiibacteriota bacterium]
MTANVDIVSQVSDMLDTFSAEMMNFLGEITANEGTGTLTLLNQSYDIDTTTAGGVMKSDFIANQMQSVTQNAVQGTNLVTKTLGQLIAKYTQ